MLFLLFRVGVQEVENENERYHSTCSTFHPFTELPDKHLQAALESLKEFWDAMDETDMPTLVLEPEKPTRRATSVKDCNRQFSLARDTRMEPRHGNSAVFTTNSVQTTQWSIDTLCAQNQHSVLTLSALDTNTRYRHWAWNRHLVPTRFTWHCHFVPTRCTRYRSNNLELTSENRGDNTATASGTLAGMHTYKSATG
ncbi:UNVERIFIED_CONTAM: hypothetical protein FKN15_056891 [Acipenser sinensis]